MTHADRAGNRRAAQYSATGADRGVPHDRAVRRRGGVRGVAGVLGRGFGDRAADTVRPGDMGSAGSGNGLDQGLGAFAPPEGPDHEAEGRLNPRGARRQPQEAAPSPARPLGPSGRSRTCGRSGHFSRQFRQFGRSTPKIGFPAQPGPLVHGLRHGHAPFSRGAFFHGLLALCVTMEGRMPRGGPWSDSDWRSIALFVLSPTPIQLDLDDELSMMNRRRYA